METEVEGPRLAFWDIEISPTFGTFWGSKYETNILEITHPWVVISFSWKEGKEHITKALPDYRGYKKGSLDDKALVREIWGLMNRVDILVGQNGDQFDCKKLNARFAIHGLTPPAPYKTVDTLKVARQKFGFTSNKLDDLGETLGLGRKLEHEGYNLWRKCIDGDMKAWKKMKRYNKQDVLLLEKVYYRLLPYMSSHPNIGMFHTKTVCSHCGSSNLQARGFITTKTRRYRRIHCEDCGGWNKVVQSEDRTKPLVGI